MVFYNMQDARAFTNWAPNCEMNNHVTRNKTGATNSHANRQYLQKNALKIMKELKSCSPINGGCDMCPVCNKAYVYKPNGKIPKYDVTAFGTNVNPYNMNPNL